MKPHPKPLVAGIAAAVLLVILGGGAFLFSRLPKEPGVGDLNPGSSATINPLKNPPTGSPTIAPSPSNVPGIDWKLFSVTDGDTPFSMDFPTEWSAPDSTYASFDPVAQQTSITQISKGVEMQVYTVSLSGDFGSLVQSDESSLTVNSHTNFLTTPINSVQFDATDSLGNHIVTTYKQTSSSAPVYAIRFTIGAQSDSNAVARQQYLDIYNAAIATFVPGE